MKSIRTLYLSRELRHRDRLLITLLSEILADRLEIQVLAGSASGGDIDDAEIEQALRARRPVAGESTLLWVSCLSLSPHVPLARELGYRVVLDHPGHPAPPPFRLRDLAGLLRRTHGRADERSLCEDAEAVVVRSQQEAVRLSRLAPEAEVHVLPSPVDSARFAALRERPGEAILFSGDYRDPAQLGGLRWFVRECLPFLRARFGDRLAPMVVLNEGHPAQERNRGPFAGPAEPGLLGFLEDIPGFTVRAGGDGAHAFEHALADAMIFVNPAREESRALWRTHAHDQIRILQAMAAGRPVLSTGVGASGLVLSPTYDVWIADAPDRFATALAQLIDNPDLRHQLSAHAVRTVEERYDLANSVARIRDILQGIKISSPD